MKGLDYAQVASKESKWQFNSKEKQTELGLHHYDFSARSYDYQINRTTTLDPHGDRYPDMSGYSFLNNNPLNTIYPTGMDGESILPQGTAYDQMKEKDDREREKNRQNKGKSNNVILTFFDVKTQEGTYESSAWNVFSDKEDMDGQYDNNGVKVNVVGLEAAYLFAEFWTKTYGKIDNLVIATHGATDKNALAFSHGITLLGSDFIPKFNKSPYVAHLKAITDLVKPMVKDKNTGNVVFLGCRAGGMYKAVNNFLNSSRDGKINIFMNKDYTTIYGNHKVGYRVPLDTWLTQEKKYKFGWVNATTGDSYANLMIRKNGTILLKNHAKK
ncbi:RHS repeat-associated core domain-containing protein [Thermoflexibacter ruber]|uniref:RHS repeat-associated core domain-containing protein n=1 Tax=Thermoflexibacter ruber TaxID=1003 RepID=A0A1I2K432_9BACT|nr:RHS repeat-associated core domain-containing protein [Thermoflexibacter ruber]SFF61089.1 RHS repeat-associated core domain-containing protein [Thermoflexibacter ruber]